VSQPADLQAQRGMAEHGGGRPAARIVMAAGEASGDLHGARLAECLRRLEPSLGLSGMGGSRMQAAGVEILADARQMGVVGLTELWEKRRTLRAAFATLRAHLEASRPALLICIDFPDFNLLLARAAHRLGIPVCYFVSPQVWAWRRGRIRTIRRLVRKMLVLFPFEEELYRAAGVEVKFVGHPLLDALEATPSREECRERLGLATDALVLGLLPGSRGAELRRLLPLLLQAAKKIRAASRGLTVLVGLAESGDPGAVEVAAEAAGVAVRVIHGRTPEVMRAADFLLAVSGTVTLEAAILGTPMLITYRLGWLTFWLARLLISVRFVGLPNLVAEDSVVPELIQYQATPGRLAATALEILGSPERLARMRAALQEVRRRLGQPGATERAAREVLALLPAEARSSPTS
jgi:lipid-A-disaccharide synthase